MKIETLKFSGLDAVHLSTSCVELVAVSGMGPRIASLSLNHGENLLYWAPTSCKDNQWRLMGGHRVWITRPLADESADTYVPDNDPCSVTFLPDGVRLVAPPSPMGLERGMEITGIDEHAFQITNFVVNKGNLLYSCGVWSPTCVNGTGGRLGSELGDPLASWDVVKIVCPLVFAGNTSVLEDDQVTFEGNRLVITPKGKAVKRCMLSKKGVVFFEKQGIRFEKKVVYDERLRYPFEGCNVALFNGDGNWMSELETYGGEKTVRPGERIEHTERWTITSD